MRLTSSVKIPAFLAGFVFSFASLNFPLIAAATPSDAKKPILQVRDKPFQLDSQGKTVNAFEVVLIQPDGTESKEGYTSVKGDWFDVIVENKSAEPITLHWHGLIVPNDQDGVPGVTQTLIQPGEKRPYKYKLVQSGTYWMHSHEGFQEQQQLSAPFVIYESEQQKNSEQDVVMFMKDFTYQDPQAIFNKLRNTKMPAMQMDNMQNGAGMQMMKGSADYNDVNYDAYITNKKTLAKPTIRYVTPGQVRLRIINAAAATNFVVDLGKLQGSLVAVDGAKVKPVQGSKFPIGIANRLDIIVNIPSNGGAFPILGQAEGTNKQTGLILATKGAEIPQLSPTASQTIGRIPYYELEQSLKAVDPLPKKTVDISLNYNLQGTMNGYRWMLNDESWPKINPKIVKKGQRVELVFTNKTAMSHPMHFHGHVFQVTEINGKPLKDGARRDTVLVQPFTTVKVQFDADNPGIWMNHCHNLYHMAGGMMTTIEFAGYPKPAFYLSTIGKTQ